MASNQSAAGLRRSALEERVRLQAEWAELKGVTTTCSALRGVVALVEVGSGSRALALRAALSALGASVVPAWVPLVTHVIWSEGGCRKVRAKARALACRLVSPLWVEACASAARRLPEQAFPSAARASDLPSPRTLKRLLKDAEQQNIPLNLVTSPATTEKLQPKQALRISSDNSDNSCSDKSDDKSMNRSKEADVPSRVNTAPRRACPKSDSPEPVKKSRRMLFTNKEDMISGSDDDEGDDDDDETNALSVRLKKSVKITQKDRRDLARAERMARRLANYQTYRTPQEPQPKQDTRLRIVLTGMAPGQRLKIHEAVLKLHGKVQRDVNKRTTHVVLGPCCAVEDNATSASGDAQKLAPVSAAAEEITGLESLSLNSPSILTNHENVIDRRREVPKKSKRTTPLINPRTLKALEGAARGCRVLRPQWVLDSLEHKQWLHPIGYDIPHLQKISQKARIERSVLHKSRQEYAYDVFCGLLVHVTNEAIDRLAAMRLLRLCGAELVPKNTPTDVVVGRQPGQIMSKWVFDSVADGKIKTTKKYILIEYQQITCCNQY